LVQALFVGHTAIKIHPIAPTLHHLPHVRESAGGDAGTPAGGDARAPELRYESPPKVAM
jgi:hypothetical protein